MRPNDLIANAKKAATAGKLLDAEHMLRQAVRAAPKDAVAWQTLGRVLMDMHRPHHAAEVFAQSLRVTPDRVDVLIDLTRALMGAGQLQPALGAAKRATQVAPNNAHAWHELARCERLLARVPDSLSHIERADSLAPNDPDIKAFLATTLHDVGRNLESIDVGRRAVGLRRGALELTILGLSLLAAGHSEEAMACMEEALASAPKMPEAIGGMAQAAEAVGDKARAIETLERAFDAGVMNNPLVGHYGLLTAGSPDKRAGAIDRVRRQLSLPQNNPANTLALHFALGALLEAQGDYAGAFEAFRAGKSLYPPTFNAELNQRRMSQLIATFSAEAMRSMPRSDSADHRPVFIVGMPRSGTTLLEQIIASHSRAAGVGELEDIRRLIHVLPTRLGVSETYPDVFRKATREALTQLASEYSDRLSQLAPGKDRVVDKMPHNYLALGAIALMFPHATLIHSTRNPLDTCLSCFTTPLGAVHGYATSLNSLVLNFREYRRVMDHWKSVLGDRLVEMEYEKLVAEPESESRRLISATGLEWDPACLKFYEGKRAVATASVSQVRRPMYDSSIGRWKRFEPFIGELIEGLKDYL